MTALWIGWCAMAWLILHAWLVVGLAGLYCLGRYIWKAILCRFRPTSISP